MTVDGQRGKQSEMTFWKALGLLNGMTVETTGKQRK